MLAGQSHEVKLESGEKGGIFGWCWNTKNHDIKFSLTWTPKGSTKVWACLDLGAFVLILYCCELQSEVIQEAARSKTQEGSHTVTGAGVFRCALSS